MTFGPLRLLYIDDNDMDRRAFRRFVVDSPVPWHVTYAETLARARSLLSDGQFDVIVADYHLPDGHSTDLFDLVETPFVLLTGTLEEQLALRTLERGADDYLVKTPDLRHLDALPLAVEKTIRRKHIRDRERELTRKLQENEQEFRAIFENAASGIVRTDSQDRLAAVNDRFCQMLGYSRQELLGCAVREFIHPDARPRSDDLNAQIRDGRIKAIQYEERYLRRDGSALWVHVGISGVHDEAGRFLYSVGTVIDISARKAAEERLHLQAALAAVPNAISISDRAGTIVWVNRAFTTLTGYDESEVIGNTHRILSSGAQSGAFYGEMWATLSRGEVWRGELINRRKDGTLYNEEMGITPLRDDNGQLTHYIAIKQDITARKRAEEKLRASQEELRATNARLQEADRRKDEFLAVLSHELRNPLAPMRNSLYVLDRAAPDSEQARRARATIERQVDHMTRLVSDLLDVSRIVRGKIVLQPDRIDLRDVVSRTVEDHRSLFSARAIEVESRQPEEPVWINGDAARLSQALGNLLQNAAKFTSAGGTVRVMLEHDGDTAVMRVRDTGVGIAPEMLPRIFQPFTQADTSLARGTGGLGLGLALVRGLTELHGGEVQALSAGPGKGAEFTMRLPVSSAPVRATQPELGRATQHARRVLIIEDNIDSAESLKEALELDRHEVILASTGQDGLKKARASRPDVVLCDIGLPGMDGYAVARAFRADAQLRDLSLVALTGYALAEDRKRATDAGFDRHLTKPVNLSLLERTLSEVSEGHAV
jgi:PAS domain S-box-containing protein